MYIIVQIYLLLNSNDSTTNKSQKQYLPNYIYILLFLSRRIHSIFLLRCFNDGICMLFLYLSFYLLLKSKTRYWNYALLCYSLALSIKMNVLLYLPALGLLFLSQYNIVITCFKFLFYVIIPQILVAYPFLKSYTFEYLYGSFNFSRKFDYKWTVNMRFLTAKEFLSIQNTSYLLILHIIILMYSMYRLYKNVNGWIYGILIPSLNNKKLMIKK